MANGGHKASMSNISTMSLRTQKRKLPEEIEHPPSKRRRAVVTIQQKREVCIYKKLNPNAKRPEINQHMKETRGVELGMSTISDILNHREKWLSVDVSNTMISSLRQAQCVELEEELYSYIVEAQSRGEVLQDAVVIQMAKDIGSHMGEKELKYSNGWLQRFKERHGLSRSKKRISRRVIVNPVTSSDDLQELKDDPPSFAPDDTYTMAETALFYAIGPAATRLVIDSNHHKLTLVLCANATGTHRLRPFVIGKQPGDKTLNSSTRVTYHCNNKVLMNQVLFQLWLQDLDIQMCLAKRKICLVLEKSSVHGVDGIHLCNVTVKFFKINQPTCISPMAAGIVKGFKLFYRKLLVHHFLQDTNPQIISIKEALCFIHQAWINVTAANIQQCWQTVDILSETFNKAQIIHLTPQTNDLSELQKLIDRLCQNPNTFLSVEKYVDIDSYEQALDVEDDIVSELLPDENTDTTKETDSNENVLNSQREAFTPSRGSSVPRVIGYIETNIKKEPVEVDQTDSHDITLHRDDYNPQVNDKEPTLNVNPGKHSESGRFESFLQSQGVEQTCVLISSETARTSLCTVIRYLQENPALSHLIDSALTIQAGIVKTQHCVS